MKEFLIQIYDILRDKSCKYSLAVDSNGKPVQINSSEATNWCLVGAIALVTKASLEDKNHDCTNVINHLCFKLKQFDYVKNHFFRHPIHTLSDFNDKHSKDEILNFLQRVIDEYNTQLFPAHT